MSAKFGVVPAAGAIFTMLWAFYVITPIALKDSKLDRLQAIGMLVVALGIAFGVAAMLRFALAPRNSAGVDADANVALRSRIAPIILSIGSIAIVLLALGLMIAFVFLATGEHPNIPVRDKIDALLTGVFTSVLPVVATWVGTVLAFYFGSENFRQAAQSTREVLASQQKTTNKVTDFMVPYDRIARVNADNDAGALKTKMLDVIHMMSEAATRIIVFNKETQTPLYIIRSTTPPMPKGWLGDDFKTTKITNGLKDDDKTPKDPTEFKCISHYLAEDKDKNKDDATNFRFVSADATTEDVLALMAKERVDDVFVTQDGQKTSRVLGWVTSSSLRKS